MELSTIVEIIEAYQPSVTLTGTGSISTIVEIIEAYQSALLLSSVDGDLQQQKLLKHTSPVGLGEILSEIYNSRNY